MSANPADIPLCVDCDGTLLRTDLLHESVLLLFKRAPWMLLLLPLWLLRGRAWLKQRLAELVSFEWETLPVNDEVVAQIRDVKLDVLDWRQVRASVPRRHRKPLVRTEGRPTQRGVGRRRLGIRKVLCVT